MQRAGQTGGRQTRRPQAGWDSDNGTRVTGRADQSANCIEPQNSRKTTLASFLPPPPPKPYLVRRDTLCSCEAYGVRSMYKENTDRSISCATPPPPPAPHLHVTHPQHVLGTRDRRRCPRSAARCCLRRQRGAPHHALHARGARLLLPLSASKHYPCGALQGRIPQEGPRPVVQQAVGRLGAGGDGQLQGVVHRGGAVPGGQQVGDIEGGGHDNGAVTLADLPPATHKHIRIAIENMHIISRQVQGSVFVSLFRAQDAFILRARNQHTHYLSSFVARTTTHDRLQKCRIAHEQAATETGSYVNACE